MPRSPSATENGTPTTNVTWAVNGITGGDAQIGTIAPDGTYTAPTRVSADTTVTITATQQNDRSSNATATVTVLAATPGATGAAVSVAVTAADAMTVNQTVGASVSVAFAELATALRASAPVSAARAPFIRTVTPATGTRGATNLSLSLAGSGFTGATSVVFLTTVGSSFAADPAITVTSITVMGGGAAATVLINIGPTAVLGHHVVQITAGGRTSTSGGTGGNLFTVQ